MKVVNIEIPGLPNPNARFGKLTMEQYLGLSGGMSLRVAGRMLCLSSDLTSDVIDLHEDSLDPRNAYARLSVLARVATQIEMLEARLMVLAAENCTGKLLSVPEAIRSNHKTISVVRSAVCQIGMNALQAEQQAAA